MQGELKQWRHHIQYQPLVSCACLFGVLKTWWSYHTEVPKTNLTDHFPAIQGGKPLSGQKLRAAITCGFRITAVLFWCHQDSPSQPKPSLVQPLDEFPRRQLSVLIVKVTADIWPGNSCQSPSPLWPQQSRWTGPLLRGNHKIWSFIIMAPPRMCTVKLPEQQQNRWKHLSFQVDFYCYYSTIRSHSTSLYLITVINLKSLLFDVSTKSILELNHARLNQKTLVSFPFPHPCK